MRWWRGTAFAMSYFEQKNASNAISRPHLVWVIQNFHLQPLSENGTELSGAEWIQRLLVQIDQSNNGTSAFQAQFNDFFASLDVKTLPFPVTTVEDLQILSTLPTSRLNPAYRRSVAGLWEHVVGTASPKTIGSLKLTGTALATLLERWTENMNIPISSYRDNSAEILLGHIMKEEISRSTVKYSEVMSQLVKPPMSEAKILKISGSAIANILGTDPSPQYLDAVTRAVKPLLDGYLKVC
mmetsp:Transcript_33103/g.69238  ORF Transcript_33103/g.69238 Transcript_33103/m.69238 type:complete len:240 (-) Transcript_33103:2503-3222(-)